MRLFQICDEEETVIEVFYCINKIINDNNLISNELSEKNLKLDEDIIHKNIKNGIYLRSKSEIEFYAKSKNFKQLGLIYVSFAKEYAQVNEELLMNQSIKVDSKKQDLIILNFYIRAAEVFLLDNCIKNYSEVFDLINKLISIKFNQEINIKLE